MILIMEDAKIEHFDAQPTWFQWVLRTCASRSTAIYHFANARTIHRTYYWGGKNYVQKKVLKL